MITESRQKRVLLIIITILLLANVATLIMFFVAKPMKKKEGSDNRKEKMEGYLKKELGYSNVQINAYQQLSAKHKTSIDSMFTRLKQEKENRMKELSSLDFSDSSIQRAALRIAENQKMVEVKMLNHLKDIRALGDERQQLKFDTGFLHYMNRHKSKGKN